MLPARSCVAICLLITAFCFLPAARAQTPPAITVDFSPQLLESFIAAFGSKLPGVAVYSFEVCTDGAGMEIPAGRIRQAAHTKFATVHNDLLFITLARAKRRNWRSVTVEALKWGTLTAASITTSGLVAASPAWMGGLTVGHALLDRLDDELGKQLPDASSAFGSTFLGNSEWVVVPPNGCAPARLLLGRYVKGLGAFTVRLQ